MSEYGSRKPLHLQNSSIAKAAKNPSYESFRPNKIHDVQYKEMEDRVGVNAQSRVRRYANAQLDFEWTARQILDALDKLEQGLPVLPIEMALLTVILPLKMRLMEPQAADILTQLSPSEKKTVAALVDAWIAEGRNYNGGSGGGTVSGMSQTRKALGDE